MSEQETWRTHCVLAGYAVTFYDDDATNRSDTEFEDDGTLHVRRHGLRACFNVQCDDPQTQNERTAEILTALGIVVADESMVMLGIDDEDDYCSQCGAPI